MSIEAMKQALVALCSANPIGHALEDYEYHNKATEALRQALAQPEQEPADIHCPSCLHSFSIVPVAKRQWVSLTDEEIDYIFGLAYADDMELLRTIEAKLKDKNG